MIPVLSGVWLILLFNLVATSATQVFQGEISIDSKVDKSVITIGGLIKYTVTVTRSPEIDLKVPAVAANLGAFEIRDYSVGDPVAQDDLIIDKIQYTISTFDVGDFEIPPLVYHYSFPDDSTRHELKTQKLQIHVKSLEPSEAGDIRDIKQPVTIERDYRKLIIWASLAVAVLVLLAISFYIWRRKRAGKGLLPQKIEPPRPADQIALEELQALKRSPLLSKGLIKQYYIQISEIIRRYIEGRYFVIALEMTSLELMADLSTADVEAENLEHIQKFLEVCDLVKFAKFQPGDEQHQAIMADALAIVELTRTIYGLTDSNIEESVNSTVSNSIDLENKSAEKTEAISE